MNPYCNAVSPGYFKTMGDSACCGARLRRARRSGTCRPIRNSRGLRRHTGWRSSTRASRSTISATRNPIGRHIGFGGDPGHQDADRNHRRRQGREVHGRARRHPAAGVLRVHGERLRRIGDGVRAHDAGTADAAFGAVRQTVRELDANIPIYNLRTLERQIDQLAAQRAADRDAVHGVRRAGDAAGGDRPLRRDGVHGRRAGRARSAFAWRSARCRATSSGS